MSRSYPAEWLQRDAVMVAEFLRDRGAVDDYTVLHVPDIVRLPGCPNRFLTMGMRPAGGEHVAYIKRALNAAVKAGLVVEAYKGAGYRYAASPAEVEEARTSRVADHARAGRWRRIMQDLTGRDSEWDEASEFDRYHLHANLRPDEADRVLEALQLAADWARGQRAIASLGGMTPRPEER